MRSRLRVAGRWLGGAALVMVVAVIALGWPRSVGGRTSYSIVWGHSMNPTYHTGDLVVLRAQQMYRVGQIVVTGSLPVYRPAVSTSSTGSSAEAT